jgi:hypothetical protein
MEMLKSIRVMLDAFEELGIEYCHWKSNEHLQSALNGDTDLDMLFDPSQRSLLEGALSKTGLKRFRAMPLMQYNAIEDYIGFDKDEAKIWHLHLHYRLTLGEKHLKSYTLPWTRYLLKRRQMTEFRIYSSNPADEYFLLLIRMSLKLRWRDRGRKIGKDDVVELQWLKERCSGQEVKAVAEQLVGEKIAEEVFRLTQIAFINKNQLLKLQKYLRVEMKKFSCFSKFSSFITREKREVFWLVGGIQRRMGLNSIKANRRISPSGGTVVAFLGCDGSGKSTTLSYVKKEFGKKIDVYTSYMGSGDGSSSLLRKPMKAIAKKVGGKGVGHNAEQEIRFSKNVSFKSRLYSVAKVIWAVTLAKEKKSKLNQIVRARNNGMLVLVDRYPQFEVSGYGDGPLLQKYSLGKGLMKKISDWEYSIYKSAYINPPDLLIKLMVPTEVAILRKPEMTAEEIDDKKAAVRSIHFGSREEEIDTSCKLIVSICKVMQAIWEEI